MLCERSSTLDLSFPRRRQELCVLAGGLSFLWGWEKIAVSGMGHSSLPLSPNHGCWNSSKLSCGTDWKAGTDKHTAHVSTSGTNNGICVKSSQATIVGCFQDTTPRSSESNDICSDTCMGLRFCCMKTSSTSGAPGPPCR